MRKKFSKEYLMEELELPYEAISDEIIGNSRWSIDREIIFKDKDEKHWKTWYSEGATECQDESPWEHEDEIECVEVHYKEVKVMKWVEIE